MNRQTLSHLHHAVATDVLEWRLHFIDRKGGRCPVYVPGFDRPVKAQAWDPSHSLRQANQAADRFMCLSDEAQHWKSFREEHNNTVRHRVIVHGQNRPHKTLFYSTPERAIVAALLSFASPAKLTLKYHRCFERA